MKTLSLPQQARPLGARYRVSMRAGSQSNDSIPFKAGSSLHEASQGAPPIGFRCSNQPGRIPIQQAPSSIATCPRYPAAPPSFKSASFSAIQPSGAPSYPPTAVTSRAGSVSPSEAAAMSKRLEALEQQVCKLDPCLGGCELTGACLLAV